METTSKNCAVASLESSLALMHSEAGVSSLSEVEQALADLRAAFDADPDGTSETAIKQVWDQLKALELDNFFNISRVWWQLSGYVTATEGTETVWFRNEGGTLEYSTDDRASWNDKFPPDAHQHLVEDITDFPASMPPDAHQHLVEDITDFSASMPPDAHQHLVEDITDFPASMPPDAHQHLVEDITDFPETMPPDAHTHDYSELTGIKPSPSYILIRDIKPAGTDGGSFLSGAWRTRSFTEITHDSGGYASLSGKQVTLLSGTYVFHILAPARDVQRHQAMLYNVSAAVVQEVGITGFTNDGAGVLSFSFCKGEMTLASPQVFEVRHRCDVTKVDSGFGRACNFGLSELYTIFELWRLG